MLHFWLEILLRAILDTLVGIGKDPADLRFSAFVFVFVTLLLLVRNYRKGFRAWVDNVKQRFWKIVGEDIAIILGLVIVILLYNALKEPYVAWKGEHEGRIETKGELDTKVSDLRECTGNLRTEQVKSQLLGNQVTAQQTQISGQQTLIVGQQANSATQQSTFDLCVNDVG
jgi:predicted membrane protein